jgi:Zn-dependent peptidase ImmA (M78 family)
MRNSPRRRVCDQHFLKQRWGASVAAMMMRLHALGLLSNEEKLALFKRRSARWDRKLNRETINELLSHRATSTYCGAFSQRRNFGG